MTDPGNLPRLYDEKEVGELLKRATEIQREEPVRAAAAGGLSLAELEEIAGEAGIDPRFLRRAAAEMASRSSPPEAWERVTGEKLTLAREAILAGELDQEGFEMVVGAIQSSAHEHGQPSLLGRTLTWRAETASKTRTIQVTVSSRHGETHVRVEERLHQLASGLFAGSIAGVGGGLGLGVGLPVGLNVFGSALLAAGFPLGVMGLTYVVVREIYRGIVRRRTVAVSAIMDAVLDVANRSIAERALAGAEGPRELPRG